MSISPDAARNRTLKWIKEAGIVVPEKCELCGTASSIQQKLHEWFNDKFCPGKRFIVAHHWRGYEYPYDVWFICYRCNRLLHGKHDGSLSKEDAIKFVKHYPFNNSQEELQEMWNDLPQAVKNDLVSHGYGEAFR